MQFQHMISSQKGTLDLPLEAGLIQIEEIQVFVLGCFEAFVSVQFR